MYRWTAGTHAQAVRAAKEGYPCRPNCSNPPQDLEAQGRSVPQSPQREASEGNNNKNKTRNSGSNELNGKDVDHTNSPAPHIPVDEAEASSSSFVSPVSSAALARLLQLTSAAKDARHSAGCSAYERESRAAASRRKKQRSGMTSWSLSPAPEGTAERRNRARLLESADCLALRWPLRAAHEVATAVEGNTSSQHHGVSASPSRAPSPCPFSRSDGGESVLIARSMPSGPRSSGEGPPPRPSRRRRLEERSCEPATGGSGGGKDFSDHPLHGSTSSFDDDYANMMNTSRTTIPMPTYRYGDDDDDDAYGDATPGMYYHHQGYPGRTRAADDGFDFMYAATGGSIPGIVHHEGPSWFPLPHDAMGMASNNTLDAHRRAYSYSPPPANWLAHDTAMHATSPMPQWWAPDRAWPTWQLPQSPAYHSSAPSPAAPPLFLTPHSNHDPAAFPMAFAYAQHHQRNFNEPPPQPQRSPPMTTTAGVLGSRPINTRRSNGYSAYTDGSRSRGYGGGQRRAADTTQRCRDFRQRCRFGN